jgi:LacI family transcriptional regulator
MVKPSQPATLEDVAALAEVSAKTVSRVVSNDDMAAAVISVAHKMGLQLPTQLSVVGFDDAPIATMIWPLLTTVRQPVRTMARLAAELIIENSPRRLGWPSPLPHQTLDFELIVRDSTTAPK